MKFSATVKPICDKCRAVRRHGTVMIICSSDSRHKQRRG